MSTDKAGIKANCFAPLLNRLVILFMVIELFRRDHRRMRLHFLPLFVGHPGLREYYGGPVGKSEEIGQHQAEYSTVIPAAKDVHKCSVMLCAACSVVFSPLPSSAARPQIRPSVGTCAGACVRGRTFVAPAPMRLRQRTLASTRQRPSA